MNIAVQMPATIVTFSPHDSKQKTLINQIKILALGHSDQAVALAGIELLINYIAVHVDTKEQALECAYQFWKTLHLELSHNFDRIKVEVMQEPTHQ